MAAVALLALVVGCAVALGLGLVVLDVFEFSQREGANAMALAFILCPLVAVLTAVVNAIRYWIVSARRTATTDSTAVAAPRGDATRVVAIAVPLVSSDGLPAHFCNGCRRAIAMGHLSLRSRCPWRRGFSQSFSEASHGGSYADDRLQRPDRRGSVFRSRSFNIQ